MERYGDNCKEDKERRYHDEAVSDRQAHYVVEGERRSKGKCG